MLAHHDYQPKFHSGKFNDVFIVIQWMTSSDIMVHILKGMVDLVSIIANRNMAWTIKWMVLFFKNDNREFPNI